MLCWPFIASSWFSVHVPVTVWAIGSIGWVNLSHLMLDNLMFGILQDLVMREDWIIDWSWLPVSVVSAPLGLVGLSLGWWWRVSRIRDWVNVVSVIGLAGGNNGIAQIIFKRHIICTDMTSRRAIRQLNPSSISLSNLLVILLILNDLSIDWRFWWRDI